MRLLTDEKRLGEKFEALGHRGFQVLESRHEGPEIVLRSTREVPADVPSFAKKFLSPMNTVIQVDRWSEPEDDIRRGTWAVEIKGTPIHMHGTTTLEPSGAGCVQTVQGQIEVKIPFIGGQIARFVAGDTGKNIALEHEANLRLLREMGS